MSRNASSVFGMDDGPIATGRRFRVAEVDDSTNQISGVAERYAQALFSLAQEQNATDAVADALSNFGGPVSYTHLTLPTNREV